MTSTQPTVTIRSASDADADTVTTVLTDAFLYSPIGDWLIPDPQIRRLVYLDYFRIFVDHALELGLIDLTSDETGVAVWFPRLHPTPEPADYEQRLAAVCGPWLRRFQILDIVFAQHYPETPHHYLAFLGVVPTRQRQGVGTALLAHHHAGLDNHGLPAYLEASTPRNRDLYRRHGYQAGEPMHLPEGGPALWPMWREPTRTPG